jgi:phage terminase large subunit-like protein
MPDLSGQECYIGIDLSSKIDLTSTSYIFPIDGKYVVLSHSFIPADKLAERRQKDKAPFDLWLSEGYISMTPGAVVDYRFVLQDIKTRMEEHGWIVREVCFDPYNATQFAQEMESEGFTMVEIRQGIPTLGEPTKNFREEVYSGKVLHDGNPVLSWAMSNAITRTDHNENIMLDKSRARDRIDPVTALINAHVRAMNREENEIPRAYVIEF